jgi:LytS/YehU family sensor histidine kinase
VIISSFIISLFITIQAIRLKKQGAWLASFAITVVTLINLLLPYSYQVQYFYPSFGLLIIIVLTSLSQKMKATQIQRNAALLNSASLEISLLKRNIQPHFILNTLTSIEQWIEENPQVAIKFIDALADEFRVLNSMSEQKLVTLQDEIDLCNSHLKIMSYRKDQSYQLELDIFNTKQLIPPAIIHTLLENALSHNIYDAATNFKLSQQQKGNKVLICLTTPLGINAKLSISSHSSGTGLKYIRARLEESFSEDWSMTQGTNETEEHAATDWISQLTMPLVVKE